MEDNTLTWEASLIKKHIYTIQAIRSTQIEKEVITLFLIDNHIVS